MVYLLCYFQPPKSIIAQAKFRLNIAVHTISFNCNDREANEFLYELAQQTGGRFHYYSRTGCELDPTGPTSWKVCTYSKHHSTLCCCACFIAHQHTACRHEYYYYYYYYDDDDDDVRRRRRRRTTTTTITMTTTYDDDDDVRRRRRQLQ